MQSLRLHAGLKAGPARQSPCAVRAPLPAAAPVSRLHSQNQQQARLSVIRRAAAPEEEPDTAAAATSTAPEEVFYEGSGSNTELALSLLLGATLVYLPLTLASLGRRLWIKWKFTSKRVIVITNSPVLKREVQVTYDKIKEMRVAPRALGAWYDAVIFLKDGSRLELVGLERGDELKKFVDSKLT